MIKNIIFDFGNVLANFYPEQLTAPHVEDEKLLRLISDVVFDRAYWDPLDAGNITDEALKAEIAKRLPAELIPTAWQVYDHWIDSLTPVDKMQELVADLKRTDKQLYLLSNISLGFANGYWNVPWIRELLEGFSGLVFSGTLGITKPNQSIFEHLLHKYSLQADECLFIDDRESNIIGAKNVGMEGYLFDGNADALREKLGL